MRVAGLDVGGSSVKAWLAVNGAPVATATRPLLTLRPAPGRAEADPAALLAACRDALAEVLRGPVDGVTVATLRQGFVLLDRAGTPLGNMVLNSDGRGAPYAGVLAGTHELTGHWPAAELTLPKLLAVRAEEPDRWAATTRLLFLHDWLIAELCGEQATEASYACAGGMADVAARGWAHDLLNRLGVPQAWLAPVVEAGTPLGGARPGWGLPVGTPVVAGCGDTQLAALGAGGLGDGVVTVVAGSSTPVQAASAAPVRDPLARPWMSTHAAPDRWAAEGNAGYPGTFAGWWDRLAPGAAPEEPVELLALVAAPYWSPETWLHRPPPSLVGLAPDTGADDVRAALRQAHAFAIRGNVEDLERALGRPASAVVLTGGGAAGALPQLVATVLGRLVHVSAAGAAGAATGGAHLVARALGSGPAPPGLPPTVLAPGDPGPWQEPYERWCAVSSRLREALA